MKKKINQYDQALIDEGFENILHRTQSLARQPKRKSLFYCIVA
jgi:hypothetical protein